MNLPEDHSISSDEYVDYLDYLYENLSVYQCLILYDQNEVHGEVISALSQKLRQRDFPICELQSEMIDDFDRLEMKFRVFLLSHSMLDKYLDAKANDIQSINVILCIGANVYNNVLQKFKSPTYDLADKLYIFSCDKVLK